MFNWSSFFEISFNLILQSHEVHGTSTHGLHNAGW